MWFYFDLDELKALDEKLTFFSYNKKNIFSFHDNDYSLYKNMTTRESIEAFLKSENILEDIKTVKILTFPRILGYVFNPVSFYFVTTNKQNLCVISITNTFKEIKFYLVSNNNFNDYSNRFEFQTIKNFYISPFIELDSIMKFFIKTPEEKFNISITDFYKNEHVLTTTASGKKRPFTDSMILKALLRFPLMTFFVTIMIHWHALILYLKKIPYIKKNDNLNLQQGARKWRP